MADDADVTGLSRRSALVRAGAVLGGGTLSGCLRLSTADATETAASETRTPTPAGTPTERPESEPAATATPESDGPPTPPGGFDETPAASDVRDWVVDANGFDGRVINRTGRDTVRVSVGAAAGGGHYGFDPVFVSVDAGTTVRWEWTGEGGGHNVVAVDGSFSSGAAVSEAGATFEHAFSTPGIYRYFCRPHRGVGMKGVVEVV
mgnify:FL=1